MLNFQIKHENGVNFLIKDSRVFFPSKNINVFPCSRRGQSEIETNAKYYDPEARLNTERTNRINTAINGFTDSFIINNSFDAGDSLTFVLAGYRVEVKNFNPDTIATVLGLTENDSILYAHLSLQTGISLHVEDYYTEILYRQSTKLTDTNYIDVQYEYKDTDNTLTDDFFVGVSLTSEEAKDSLSDYTLISYNLPLFYKVGGNWELVEASKLPKVEHDTEPDSIKLSGDFTVNHSGTASFKVIKDSNTSKTTINTTELEVTGKAVINGATTLQNTLEVADKVTAKNGLEVSNSDLKVTTGTLTVNKNITTETGNITAANGITTTKDLIVSNNAQIKDANIDKAIISSLEVTNQADIAYINVGTPTNKTTTSGDIIAQNNISAEGTITADNQVSTPTLVVDTINSDAEDGLTITPDTTINKNLTVIGETDLQELTATEVSADTIIQNGNQVPVITLEQISTGEPEIWQLQIDHVIKKLKT